ncbi:hypothetical protein LEP1GSC150_5614 [Leptospira interrogans serovar Copenhageni str. LT2050]|uniref:Uncharacterized protein n=1 Tax=Leptospira interrogans serovar Copenhageni str. LT2050 TaxID=1001598 RepID=M3HY30_LEPIT|nr:hypothetical protein LEP1GSC150_5614 [Leptospira interrogans serovar Copenhageni str. LT2050]
MNLNSEGIEAKELNENTFYESVRNSVKRFPMGRVLGCEPF